MLQLRKTSVLLSVSDISNLVIPDGCVGLPTLAAMKQGIPVIAVEECYRLCYNTHLKIISGENPKTKLADCRTL